MPSLTDRLLSSLGLQRSVSGIPAWWPMLADGMLQGYPQTTLGRDNKQESIGLGFSSLATQAYASNPVVFACINARVQLFSEARFAFQRIENATYGELFSNPSTYLRLINEPWPGGTTSQLLKDALIDADLAGNAFILREANGLRRLRPDWVTIIAGNPRSDGTTWDLDTEVVGYGYQPDGPLGGKPKTFLQRDQVAHFKSTHDPLRRFSGMSWLLPIIREVESDRAGTAHKQQYWENAATPNLAIQFDQTMTLAQAKDWTAMFKADHEGARNAFKTLFLGGGASLQAVGDNLQKAAFTNVQAAGELRIASAAGVPPIIIGLAGGLDAATYSNYGQARRAFADLTMRPLWRDMAGALTSITVVPAGARLWYDDRDISFLQEDVKDAADIQSTQASAMRQLVDAGFEPQTIIDAVTANDFARLKHSGLYSVQLQPPNTEQPKPEQPAAVAPQPAAALLNSGEQAGEVRCSGCDRLLAEVASTPYRLRCSRCKTLNESGNLIAA
jgi:phage portal protein BeeE